MRLIERIRTGDWVTARRVRLYPRLFLAVCLALAVVAILRGQGSLTDASTPLGTDFISFWSAANLVAQGRPAAAYDHAALQALEQTITGPDGPLYTWLYPPMALLVVAPLAALPYPAALVAWLGLTLAGYLTALWRLLPERRALLPLLAFPPLFINLGHGQNAFLSAALLGWGLVLLPRRPWLAGLLMGTLIYKPQLGLLLPVALLAAGQGRAVLGAGLAALALMGATYGLWGSEVWIAFLAKSDYARQMLEQGLVPWYKMTSVFAAARMLGGGVGVGWALQGLASLIAAATVWRLWRGPAAYPLKVAALAAWLGLTLAGYLTALWRLLPERRALLPLLAFPPLFINLGHGQNAFLSAALLGWGLLLLPRRPWLAGLLLGTLIYKPQLGLLLPVALLAAGQGRAFLGAGLAALALAGATYGLWGSEVWTAFLAKSDYARQMLEQGLVPWYKMTSVFAAARLLGAGVGVAWALQGLASLIAAATVWRLWRGPAAYPIKVAALAIGTLVAAPLALDYDATLLGLALAAWVAEGRRRGFGDWEISTLALAWMSPLFWRPLAQVTSIPWGTLTLVLLLWLVIRHARRPPPQSAPHVP